VAGRGGGRCARAAVKLSNSRRTRWIYLGISRDRSFSLSLSLSLSFAETDARLMAPPASKQCRFGQTNALRKAREIALKGTRRDDEFAA